MIHVEHLDLNVTEHCNYRCAGCSHAAPLMSPWSMSLEEIERDLTALKPFIKPRNITIVGGEPTLHKQIVEVVKLVKHIRIDDQTWVITNGSLLDRMPEDFWKELEYLRISIYPKHNQANIDLAQRKSAEYGFGIECLTFNEFYKQVTPLTDGKASFKACPWKTDCYTVHKGHFFLCPQAAFWPKSLLNLPEFVDGLPLDGLTDEKLKAYMHRSEPFEACKRCRGFGKKMPWKETTRAEWELASAV